MIFFILPTNLLRPRNYGAQISNSNSFPTHRYRNTIKPENANETTKNWTAAMHRLETTKSGGWGQHVRNRLTASPGQQTHCIVPGTQMDDVSPSMSGMLSFRTLTTSQLVGRDEVMISGLKIKDGIVNGTHTLHVRNPLRRTLLHCYVGSHT